MIMYKDTRPALSSPHTPNHNDDSGTETGIITKPQTKTKKPDRFKVIIVNDDFTPMEFVVYVLEVLFNKKREEATTVMLHIHREGFGVCGLFPYEIAETKAAQLVQLAKQNEHPLQCRVEKE